VNQVGGGISDRFVGRTATRIRLTETLAGEVPPAFACDLFLFWKRGVKEIEEKKTSW